MIIETDRVRSESYTYSTTAKAKSNADVISEYQKVVEEKKVELSERLQGGNDQVSYQIGAQSFTEREWNKLIDEYDYAQNELKKLMRERHEERVEQLEKTEEIGEELERKKLMKASLSGTDMYVCSDALFSICHVPTGETANVYKAENYTEDNPVYIVKGRDINGNDYEQEINVNDINPNKCSYIEVLAWSVHTGNGTPENYLKLSRMREEAKEASFLDAIDFAKIVNKLMEEMKKVGALSDYLEYKKWLEAFLKS